MSAIPAGGDEQSAQDHLARRGDRETAGLPDVHPIKGGAGGGTAMQQPRLHRFLHQS